MNKTQQQIRDYFFSQKDEICTHLKHLMEIKSISDDRKACKEALRYVIKLAESFGMKTAVGKHARNSGTCGCGRRGQPRGLEL